MRKQILISSGIVGVLFLFGLSANALNNGLGLTPPMGWNSWNKYGCAVNAAVVKANGDMLAQLGLDKLGYVYVNIDDCWMNNTRDADNKIQYDTTKFPDGIKNLSDYFHNKSMKLGIYSSAGTKTCAGYMASLGHEANDSQTFADWGVDYLKYDNCFSDGTSGLARYGAMQAGLNKTGRPIFFSICSWGWENVWEWGSSIGNSWRTTDDIMATWNSIYHNF
jgi:alpha-galactosidase